MITYSSRGSFKKTYMLFEKLREGVQQGTLDKYGREGVAALAAATPLDTGETAKCWTYEIVRENGRTSIIFDNSHVEKHVNIAIILQYGHGTRNGGWVEGRDYINPAIQPIFDKIANTAWKEVTGV